VRPNMGMARALLITVVFILFQYRIFSLQNEKVHIT